MNWNEINQKVVAGTLSGIAMVACIGLFTYTNTRASTEQMDALEAQHAKDIEALETSDEAIKETIRSVDWKVTAIAVMLDQNDRDAGGDGLPAETLRRSP